MNPGRMAIAFAAGLSSAVIGLPAFGEPAGNGLPGCLVAAARSQVGVTVNYDGRYVRLRYPGGDVPQDRGVCTDVLVRAYRKCGSDLQVLVHEDMIGNWGAYPKFWGLSKPDKNIDHRRVPNLAVFFSRKGTKLAVTHDPGDYKPGDIVTWRLPSGVPHIGLVSDSRTGSSVPLVVHNIGEGVREEDILFLYPITGHYRYMPGH
jgi:uncharacterized protein YijF (DUF1287 family)